MRPEYVSEEINARDTRNNYLFLDANDTWSFDLEASDCYGQTAPNCLLIEEWQKQRWYKNFSPRRLRKRATWDSTLCSSRLRRESTREAKSGSTQKTKEWVSLFTIFCCSDLLLLSFPMQLCQHCFSTLSRTIPMFLRYISTLSRPISDQSQCNCFYVISQHCNSAICWAELFQ